MNYFSCFCGIIERKSREIMRMKNWGNLVLFRPTRIYDCVDVGAPNSSIF